MIFPGLEERIGAIRGELTEEEFAKKLGVEKTSIGKGPVPTVFTLAKIAETGGVTVDYLLYGDRPPVAGGSMARRQWILYQLQRRGLSAAAIARKLGVSRSKVSDVMSGRCKGQRVREEIAQVLKMKIEKIWKEEAA